MARGWWLLASGLVLSSCGGMPAYVESAYYRDLASLRRDIRSAVAAGHVEEKDVVTLARAVARREVRSATGSAALARIQAARGCVAIVEAELLEHAGRANDAGAMATQVLLESGRQDADALVEQHFESPSGAWRAVAARATRAGRLSPLRRHYYVDPDERVRRAALFAGVEAAEPADRAALLEAARLDPATGNRSLAVRALGRLDDPQSEGIVAALADIWPRADDDLRLAIVEAFGAAALLRRGGREQLLSLAEARQGLVAVSAAAALARADSEVRKVGEAVLVHFIAGGTRDERFLAIQLAGLVDDGVVAALEAAGATGGDPEVAVVAWARLLEVPSRATRARQELRRIAGASDGASRQAQAALAAAGDPATVPWLVRSMSGTAAAVRLRAALGLFRLGRAGDMAPALADPDPEVRMSVACALASGGVPG